MILCGAFDTLGRSRPALMLELRLWRPLRDSRGGQRRLLPASPALTENLGDYSESRKYWEQRRILGISLGSHPMAVLRPAIRLAWRGVDAIDSRDLRRWIGCPVRLAGVLESYNATRGAGGREVKFFTFDDEWGLFEVTAFADRCRLSGRPAEDINVAVVTGIVEEHFDVLTVHAKRIDWQADALRTTDSRTDEHEIVTRYQEEAFS